MTHKSDTKEQSIESVYYFCPRCAEPNDQVGEIPFRCNRCGMAAFFGPVAAVGALVTNARDELLLVRRAREPGKGCWGLPGGFVDRNETVESALARELKEETQLIVTSCQLLMTYPNQYNYGGVIAPVIDLFYRCEVESPDNISLAADELDHHVWADPKAEHLENMAFRSNRIAIEHLMSLRG
jgi:ADP-ribose pyrophosphatase